MPHVAWAPDSPVCGTGQIREEASSTVADKKGSTKQRSRLSREQKADQYIRQGAQGREEFR